MANTTYNLVLETGEETRYSRKDTAIKAGEKSGSSFTVQTGSGNVVHTHLFTDTEPAEVTEVTEDLVGTLEPVEAEAEEVAPEAAPEEQEEEFEAAAPEPQEEAPAEPAFEAVVNYRDHGPKHFWKALGRTAVEVFEDDGHVSVTFNNRDFSVHFRADQQIIADAMAERVGNIWDDAMEALKGFKKTDEYRACDKKLADGRAQAYELEQKFLSNFVADALDDTDEVI